MTRHRKHLLANKQPDIWQQAHWSAMYGIFNFNDARILHASFRFTFILSGCSPAVILFMPPSPLSAFHFLLSLSRCPHFCHLALSTPRTCTYYFLLFAYSSTYLPKGVNMIFLGAWLVLTVCSSELPLHRIKNSKIVLIILVIKHHNAYEHHILHIFQDDNHFLRCPIGGRQLCFKIKLKKVKLSMPLELSKLFR